MKVKTLGETPLKEDKLEEDPYGLKNDAQGWLEHDMKSDESPENNYRPLLINTDDDEKLKEDIKKAVYKAATEYWERVEKADEDNTMKPIQPVLVAFGVSKKNMEMFHCEEALGSGRFLYFPTLNWIGEEGGALFLTYMAGTRHGATDAAFQNCAYKWLNNSGLNEILTPSVNSGGNGRPQPDWRIYPDIDHTDADADRDEDNDEQPYSRLIWECEYKHRNIIKLREHGLWFMNRTEYTRLFVGCKFTAPAQQDGEFEASIVLWGKGGAEGTIEALEAFSFGSTDISDETKNQWEDDDGGANKLPPVVGNQWRRPQDADGRPWKLGTDTDPNNEWSLHIPFQCLLYKVRDPESDQDFLDDLPLENGRPMLNGTPMEDLVINLKFMALKISKESLSKKRRRGA